MIGAIIQARLHSTRLPRKVLLDMPKGSGVTVLERVVHAVMGSVWVDQYVVTTPDKELAQWCAGNDIHWIHWTGPRDVLAEFYSAAQIFRYDPLVRITADCPLMLPKTIDAVVGAYLSAELPMAYNHCDDKGGPGDGQDVEVFSFEALEKAYNEAVDEHEKEHVGLWIRGNMPCQVVAPPEGECLSLDTMEDYHKICELWEGRKVR